MTMDNRRHVDIAEDTWIIFNRIQIIFACLHAAIY